MATKQRKIGLVIGGVLTATGLGFILSKVLGKEDETIPSDLEISDLEIEPTDPQVGEAVKISILAANVGAESITHEFKCQVVDFTTLTKTVTLDSGDIIEVTFEYTPTEARTYTVKVSGLSGSFTATSGAAFTGFSIMLKNAPSGTAYWVTQEGFFEINEAAWWYETTDPFWLYIAFLTSELASTDPDSALCYIYPEDGHNYILDVSTCELTENPNPPERPEEPEASEPGYVSAEYPSEILRAYIGDDGDPVRPVYDTAVTLWLPHPWLGMEVYYYVSLIVENGDEYPPDICGGGAVPVGYAVTGNTEAILEGDGIYTLHGKAVLGSSEIPGTWPVRCIVSASHIVGTPGNWSFTKPQEEYDLGIIGNVTLV